MHTCTIITVNKINENTSSLATFHFFTSVRRGQNVLSQPRSEVVPIGLLHTISRRKLCRHYLSHLKQLYVKTNIYNSSRYSVITGHVLVITDWFSFMHWLTFVMALLCCQISNYLSSSNWSYYLFYIFIFPTINS